MSTLWMVRSDRGSLYEQFRDQSVAAIGWAEIGSDIKTGMTRQEIASLYRKRCPNLKDGTVVSGAGQVWRFINEMSEGDHVITYSPDNRTYLVGSITGPAAYQSTTADDGLALVRPIKWLAEEVHRDQLSQRAKNSLGSTLTVFALPEEVAQELIRLASGTPDPSITIAPMIEQKPSISDAEIKSAALTADPLDDIDNIARERIKDKLISLSWDEMQELVAGILRAMGYKTQVAAPGPDRGKDIIASPDGFGFEHPRIVVEVKHRTSQMDSKAIRSFLGGRHQDDRGLYVSTGGFTKDAHYEADRAAVPLTLWTMDTLVRALVDHYDKTDTETKRLVPLKRLYVPA